MTDIQANKAVSDHQDHDSPWKEALELYLENAMALLFPVVYQAIDWAQPVTFLDKELQKILAKAERTRTYADKLVKVKLTSGEEKWLLIHIEVQGEPEEGFAQRMFDYNSRIRQRYKKDVISLAILTDSRKQYRPDEYLFEMLGCRIQFNYPVVKLLDFLPQREALLNDENVFGLIVVAQLDAKQLKDPRQRFGAKESLVRKLYQRGFDRKQVLVLFDLIDWMITLPHNLEYEFKDIVHQIEEEQQMAYMNTIERLAVEQGIQQGMQQGIQQGMQQGRLELAIKMVRRFNLSVKEAAEEASVSVKELMDRLNQEEPPKS